MRAVDSFQQIVRIGQETVADEPAVDHDAGEIAGLELTLEAALVAADCRRFSPPDDKC